MSTAMDDNEERGFRDETGVGEHSASPQTTEAESRAEPGFEEASPGTPGGTADLIRPNAEPDAVAAGDGDPDRGGKRNIDQSGRDEPVQLLPEVRVERFQRAWEGVQVGFVDEPQESVERADQLVAELMRELAESFAQARTSLEAEWGRGEHVSTEDLRVALQRYRSFFQRLLAA